MQYKDIVAQILFWQNLNAVMLENEVSNVNFKGFMVDIAQLS
jgi:hypothetical protein